MPLLSTFFRRILAFAVMIGPFAFPAEAQSASEKMWMAIQTKDAAALRVAIGEGANPNELSADGRLPIYRALRLENEQVVETLLELGADPNAKDHNGDPLIFTALSVDNDPAALALIRSGADANVPDSIGMSPLVFAVTLKKQNIIAALLKAGADVNVPSVASDGGPGGLPIFLAIRSGNLAIVQQLVAAGADVNARDEKGSTPLHRAVLLQPADYAVSLVTTLLRAGADANAMRPKGGAPLHNLIFGAANLPPAAVGQIATQLAQHGADVNLPADFDGATPLDIARAKRDQAAVTLLTNMGGTCATTCSN